MHGYTKARDFDEVQFSCVVASTQVLLNHMGSMLTWWETDENPKAFIKKNIMIINKDYTIQYVDKYSYQVKKKGENPRSDSYLKTIEECILDIVKREIPKDRYFENISSWRSFLSQGYDSIIEAMKVPTVLSKQALLRREWWYPSKYYVETHYL